MFVINLQSQDCCKIHNHIIKRQKIRLITKQLINPIFSNRQSGKQHIVISISANSRNTKMPISCKCFTAENSHLNHYPTITADQKYPKPIFYCSRMPGSVGYQVFILYQPTAGVILQSVPIQTYQTKGQASPDSLLRAAPLGIIPSQQKSPPLVPLGLHGLFVGFRTINPSLFFSVMFFAINPSFTVMFFQNHCFNSPTRSKKTRQKKTTPSYYT